MDDGCKSQDCDVSVETFRRSDKKDDRLRQSNESSSEEETKPIGEAENEEDVAWLG